MIQQTKHCKKNLDNIKNKYEGIKIIQLTVAIIALALAYFAMPAAAETNLIANWAFNEDAGTVAADTSGTGNNVNLINGPTWTTGVNGNALQFDGTNDYAVKTSATDIPAKSPFSVVAWVNGKSFSNPKWSDIVRKEGSWAVQIGPNSNLNLEITDKHDTVSDIVVPTNVWTHIAVTFEGTTVKFYKNGVLGDTKIQTNVPNEGINTIDIGGYTSWGTYLNGMLDDVKVYNRALSAADINADYLDSSMSTIPASAPTSEPLPQATHEPTLGPTSETLPQATHESTPGNLLWDGSFHGNEYRSSKAVFIDPSGSYSSSCLAQPESFAVVNANTLPGGRTGYAGKFYLGVGSAYECNSNKHNMIVGTYNLLNAPNKENWIGWSQYLAPGWYFYAPSGSATLSIGVTPSARLFSYSGKGFGIGSLPYNYRFQASLVDTTFNIDLGDMSGKWYDWVVHVKWARDKTGFYELYVREPGQQDYRLLGSRYNFVSEYPQPQDYDRNGNYVRFEEIRVGDYGSMGATKEQTVYILNPKVGTKMADVVYRG